MVGRVPSPTRGARLSRPVSDLRPHYTVVVVGSGYGGSIAASRLARAGQAVCLLERGVERWPGDYPDTLRGAATQLRARTPAGDLGSPTGLWDLHLDRDMSVMVGCGLGGTSLINAGVALRPSARVFDDSRWPAALREHGALDEYYALAERMLGANPYPAGSPALAKLAALQRTAAAFHADVIRPPLAVTFADGVSRGGIPQQACQLCGDCVTGCNFGAKNTTLMNYLPDAHRHGAHLVTEVAVRTVRRRPGGGWTVAFDALAAGRPRYRSPAMFVTADVVILAAGTLGSTEILLRSAAAGLPTSARLGEHFSGNGDVLALAYDTDAPVHGIGRGRRAVDATAPVGPCIAGLIDLTGPPTSTEGNAQLGGIVDIGGIAVEEGALPGALAAVLPAALLTAATLFGTDGRRGWRRVARVLREAAEVGRGAYRGAAARTLTYLVMSPDDANGRLVLDTRRDRVAVDWKDVGDRPVFGRADRTLRHGAAGLGGTYLPNPLWSAAFGHSLITVHPLGGAVLADDAADGVVNDRGQVFAGTAGAAVHEGLYVADGSIVPRALDANPLLTISALAERTVRLLAADRGWTIAESPADTAAAAAASAGPTATAAAGAGAGAGAGGDAGADAGAGARGGQAPGGGRAAGGGRRAGNGTRPTAVDTLAAAAARTDPAATAPGGDPPPPTPSGGPERRRPGLRFTERMAGFVSTAAPDDPYAGEAQGRADGTPLEFLLTAEYDDVQAVLDDPATPATTWGTVLAPWLSPTALRIADGRLVLIEPVPDEVETWHMTYRLRLLSEDGVGYTLDGHKVLHERPGLTAWADTTTLFVTLRGDGTGEPVATGILRISAADFTRLLRTIEVPRAGRAATRRYALRFAWMFAGQLRRVYGGPLDEADRFPEPPGLPGPPPRRLPTAAADHPLVPEPRWRDRAGSWHDGWGRTADATLRLTRYQGGAKGPVLLAPGFGMSTTAFVTDTVPDNLTGYLTRHGYDVWLFDYRASIDLPTSRTEFSLDVIATEDWPAAVDEIRRSTGAEGIQAVGHCVGSVSMLMALGAGATDGIRSAVAGQFPLHPVTSALNRAKADLHLGNAFAALGLHVIAPADRPSPPNVALDLALRAVPVPTGERCGQAVCRWVNAIYGTTHRHAQLNDATHDALNQWFGVGNVTSLRHLGSMMQRGLAVTADGQAAYTQRPDRLAIPIQFLQGTANYIFLPEGTRRTVEWLSNANDPALYSRVVLAGYAHLDCLVGRNAARDVFPVVLDHLDRT